MKKEVLDIKSIEGRTKQILKDGEKESKDIINDSEKLADFINQFSKIDKSNFTKEIYNYLELMTALVKSYYRKEYRKAPIRTIISVVSALIYVLTVLDIIPDFIPGLGQLDDAIVVAFCFKMVKDDLDEYALWLEENPQLDYRKNKKKDTKKKSNSKKQTTKSAKTKKNGKKRS